VVILAQKSSFFFLTHHHKCHLYISVWFVWICKFHNNIRSIVHKVNWNYRATQEKSKWLLDFPCPTEEDLYSYTTLVTSQFTFQQTDCFACIYKGMDSEHEEFHIFIYFLVNLKMIELINLKNEEMKRKF
jgi:hypothetical protein